jgi:membrane fusion protein, multidrug efflux system
MSITTIVSPGCRWAFLVICAVILAGGGCGRTPPPSLQVVSAGTVQRYTPDAGQKFSTSISPFAQVDLAFKSGGLVENILQVKGNGGDMRPVGVGDKVTAGTELARVRVTDYEFRVRAAQAALDQAKAQLASAQANQEDAKLNYDRATNLYQTASLTKPDYDSAVQKYTSAVAAIQSAQAGIANAQSDVDTAKLALHDTSIRAPFPGWIVARYVESGMLSGNDTKAFTMVDTRRVKATFAVPDYTLSDIRLGQRQDLRLDTVPETVHGTVTAISQVADPSSRVFSVEITIGNPKDTLRPGMIGSLTIGQGQAGPPCLVVPLSAITSSKDIANGFAVFVLEESAEKTYARSHDVQIGRTYGNSIEVLSGLAAGQRVVVAGGPFLTDGQEVRVIP